MKLLIAGMVVTALSGCSKGPDYVSPNSLTTQSCSEEQWAKVEKEAKFCAENSSHFKSYCLSSAMTRNCDKHL